MTRPSDKKRKAQASEQTLEDGLGATQHSRLPLGRSDDMKVQERLRAKATVFNPVPHPAFAPWHGDFAAPTPPYENQQACPIDWSRVTIIHDDPLHCQEAYELRRPWDKEAVAWDRVAEKVFFPPAEDGTVRHISPEGVRKRFKAANRAVFELTGVYFPESSLGLEGHGIPLYKELKPMLKGLGEVRVVAKRETKVRDLLEYEGEVFQLVVFPPNHKDGFNRFVTKEVMEQLIIHEDHFLRYSLDSFDRWYTSIFLGRRHTLPRRLYRLEPWEDDCYMHLDIGTPSVTMSDLFETYRLSQEMGTTEVSDMILDEIVQSFRRENELFSKHEEHTATLQELVTLVHPLSFDFDDIKLLWEHTEIDDPIRRLVVEICTSWENVIQHENPTFREENGSLQEFCAKYHNHVGYGVECFRSKPESSRLIPEKLSDPKIITFVFEDVEYRIEDHASHGGVILDSERVMEEHPDWEWPRIRSITSHVEGSLTLAPEEELVCSLRPSYHEVDTVDPNGRYPSHPGYLQSDWALPDPESEVEGPDCYQEPWEIAIKRDIPVDATNYREETVLIEKNSEGEPIYKVTAIFFEIEDPAWRVPDDWEADMDTDNLSLQEVKDYKRWLWVDEGGVIPRIKVQRFRPFEHDAPSGTDPFVDQKKKVSIAYILR